MTMEFLISLLMFVMGLISFSINRVHLLVMLLSLEFLVLSLYYMLSLSLGLMIYESFFLMILLSMSVCEGVLGLSILVSMIRVHGNDMILTFSSLW
uniref:NADH-ubiquinone oxidoreductase chain 4L n=1 Tax=Caryopemon giganteus TaxID=2758555 RepID=A0A7D6VDI9_9CUCU|nr:NADH dehydrogenase subunit 4L [Caryopemon giganteus]QLX47631.1 NADH dehydrogenase subunit 4L [Caryopemon giganteus]